MEKEVFILIITCIEPKDAKKVSSSAILLSNFKEALNIAREDAKNYKHLATHYTELIGDNKCHAEIKLYGKYINKTYRISNMTKGGPCAEKCLQNRMSTYYTYDYYDDGILF